MAANSAVKESIRESVSDLELEPRSPRASALSPRERFLLAGAFGFACFAVAISIIARVAPSIGGGMAALGIGVSVFGLGAIAGVAGLIAGRAGAKANADAKPLPTHLNGILANAPVGIAIWNPEGILLRANDLYAEYLQLAGPDAIEGCPRWMIRVTGGRPLPEILENESGVIRNAKGSFRATRQRLPGGSHIEILNDITHATQVKDNLSTYEDQMQVLLEELVSLREQTTKDAKKIDRLETTLASELDRADSASRAKADFLSHMSHEFRTPLNAILGFADMMRGQIFGPLGHEKYIEYAEDIHHSGEQILRMVNDILDLTQMQSGDIPIDRHRFPIEREVASCLHMIRPRMYASGLTINEQVDGLPTVNADPMAVRQILLHIFSNAMKFTPTGGRITVRGDYDPDWVTISIDDNGIGIAPDILHKIDQPFATAEHNALISGNDESGLGVGLAVSRALARLNGGHLTIESEQGYGTTVHISLPRK